MSNASANSSKTAKSTKKYNYEILVGTFDVAKDTQKVLNDEKVNNQFKLFFDDDEAKKTSEPLLFEIEKNVGTYEVYKKNGELLKDKMGNIVRIDPKTGKKIKAGKIQKNAKNDERIKNEEASK